MPTSLARRGLAALVAASTLALGTVAPAHAKRCDHAGAPPSRLTADQAREAIRCLVNVKRHMRGLPKLRDNEALDLAAQSHSTAMEQADFFSHDSPDGSTPASRAEASGYTAEASSWEIGENLAWGSGPSGTPRATVRGWLRSGSHRDVLLRRSYRHLGVGFVIGSPQGNSADAGIYAADLGDRG